MDNEQLFEPFSPGFGQEWLENTFIPQSIIFYSQILPVVYQLAWHSRKKPVRVCDIGAGSGAGADLIVKACNNLLAVPMEITAFDLERRFLPYAKAKYPSIRYVVGDFFAYNEEPFEIAIVSHTLEHVEAPREFVTKLLDRVTTGVVVFVPYREKNLIPGHLVSFDSTLVHSMPGMVWARQFHSVGWRAGEDASVLAFVCVTDAFRNSPELSPLLSSLDNEFFVSSID